MKIVPRLLYLFCFIGMSTSAALALDRALDPSMSTMLFRAVIVAAFCAAAGLVHRKAWAVSLVLLPLGCYLLLRIMMPPPATVDGIAATYRFYVEQLAVGATQYKAKFFPLSLTGAPELRLLLVFSVYWLMGCAGFFALSLRRPLPGIGLALLLLGFSLTVDTIPKTVGLGVVFFILAACLMIFSRGLDRRTWRLREAVPGLAIGALAALVAIMTLGAAPSAAATPWQDWRTWNPFNQGSPTFSFNWLQNYPDLLNPAKNVVIMRVESSLPSYWRANALDSFTGEAWVASQTFEKEVQEVQDSGTYVYSIPPADPEPTGQTVTENFQVRSVYTNYFFTGGDPRSLTIGENVTTLRMNQMRALHVVHALGPSVDYSITAVIPKVTPGSLVGLGSDYPDGARRYLALPFPAAADLTGPDKDATWRETVPDTVADGWQWADLYSLDQKIVGDATDPYDVALRIEKYLRNTYEYNLQPPASDYPSPYAAFLFDTHTGYCQHFAGAMALLLRFNGIPSRVAVGFATGDLRSPGVYSVSTNNAHAWVEAYFPNVGWVPFDPTPGYNLPTPGGSSTSPGFKNPFTAGTSGQSTSSSTPPTTDFQTKHTDGEPAGQKSGPSWISKVPWLPWVIGLAVVLAAWPFGRGLWRERTLRRGSLAQRLAASLGLLRGDLAAYGIPLARSRTFEEVLDVIETELEVPRDSLLATRAAAILFGGRAASEEDVLLAEDFRRTVGSRLRERYGWPRTALYWYGLPQPRRSRFGSAPARSPAPQNSSLLDLA